MASVGTAGSVAVAGRGVAVLVVDLVRVGVLGSTLRVGVGVESILDLLAHASVVVGRVGVGGVGVTGDARSGSVGVVSGQTGAVGTVCSMRTVCAGGNTSERSSSRGTSGSVTSRAAVVASVVGTVLVVVELVRVGVLWSALRVGVGVQGVLDLLADTSVVVGVVGVAAGETGRVVIVASTGGTVCAGETGASGVGVVATSQARASGAVVAGQTSAGGVGVVATGQARASGAVVTGQTRASGTVVTGEASAGVVCAVVAGETAVVMCAVSTGGAGVGSGVGGVDWVAGLLGLALGNLGWVVGSLADCAGLAYGPAQRDRMGGAHSESLRFRRSCHRWWACELRCGFCREGQYDSVARYDGEEPDLRVGHSVRLQVLSLGTVKLNW